MPKFFYRFALALILISCSTTGDKQKDVKPLVHEGMSSDELRDVLGEPLQREAVKEIFDAETMTKIGMQKWVYGKRTVLLINDTVKDANLN